MQSLWQRLSALYQTAADGAIAVFALAITALTGTLSIEETLSGFGNKTIWLIVIAFLFRGDLLKPV
ncbi:anion permease [Bacillus licheniformis]|nr:anion permease [Bacillus licheniformis]